LVYSDTEDYSLAEYDPMNSGKNVPNLGRNYLFFGIKVRSEITATKTAYLYYTFPKETV
jgi:hypothetical protein